mgnify:FL=1
MKKTTAILAILIAIAFVGINARAALILNQSTWTGDVDMTALGTVDWVVWDTDSADKNTEWTDPLSDARVEKAGGTAIGALNTLTTDNPYTQLTKDNGGDEVELNWTDGDAPTSGEATQGLRTGTGTNDGSSLGHGFTFDVTAGPASQTLYVYTGTNNADGTFRAILKDGLGDEIVSDSATLTTDKGIWDVTFSDADAATLTIEWENTNDTGNWDNVQIFGAAVIPEPASLALLCLAGAAILGRRRR